MSGEPAGILVVDDNATNRLKLSMAVKNLGHSVAQAEDGVRALEMLRAHCCDLVLLDILMPEMDGYQVLAEMKADMELRNVPVIVISAVEEMDSVVACIEQGAEDYLPKDFDPVLLRARIGASLEKKRLRDAVLNQMRFIREIFGKYVPESVVTKIVESEGVLKPERTEATILHTDIEGFTTVLEANEPERSFQMMNEYFALMLEQINRHGGVVNQLQGDAMQVLFNVPVATPDHADRALRTAQDIQRALKGALFAGIDLRTRIGINTGEVVVGNVGSGDRMNYTVLGDPVNVAARLEQLNKDYDTLVLVAGSRVERLTGDYPLVPTGTVPIRGKQEPVQVSQLRV